MICSIIRHVICNVACNTILNSIWCMILYMICRCRWSWDQPVECHITYGWSHFITSIRRTCQWALIFAQSASSATALHDAAHPDSGGLPVHPESRLSNAQTKRYALLHMLRCYATLGLLELRFPLFAWLCHPNVVPHLTSPHLMQSSSQHCRPPFLHHFFTHFFPAFIATFSPSIYLSFFLSFFLSILHSFLARVCN